MPSSQKQSHPITLVISEVVEPSRMQEYEAWTKGINQAAQNFEGFLGVDIIRPSDHSHPEFVVIVKFDYYRHFRTWLTSPDYKAWMAKSQGLVSFRSRHQEPTGLELWFTLPKNSLRQLPQPAYYKQVILGVITVYPLILLANVLVNPFLKGLPPLLALFISVTFVSALITYPVMPWLTKLLNNWLYPSASKRHHH